MKTGSYRTTRSLYLGPERKRPNANLVIAPYQPPSALFGVVLEKMASELAIENLRSFLTCHRRGSMPLSRAMRTSLIRDLTVLILAIWVGIVSAASLRAADASLASLEQEATTNNAAKFKVGVAYYKGSGAKVNWTRAFEMFVGASTDPAFPEAKYNLAVMYARGEGTERNEASAISLLQEVQDEAAASKPETARRAAAALRLLEERAKTGAPESDAPPSDSASADNEPIREPSVVGTKQNSEAPEAVDSAGQPWSSRDSDYPTPEIPSNYVPVGAGSGFFISEDGFFITNQHVTKGNRYIVIKSGQKFFPAALVGEDDRNDLAILKVSKEKFHALPIQPAAATVAQRVFTYGFPDPEYQGFAPKFTDGSISSLSGENDDPTAYQITVPVQHGNSGGPLMDFYGNVVGVVARIKVETRPFDPLLDKQGKVYQRVYAPQNVNYAIKASLILSLVNTVPDLAKRLPKSKSTSRERNQSEVAAEVVQAIGQVFTLGPASVK